MKKNLIDTPEKYSEFLTWALSFILITEEMTTWFDVYRKTMEEAKMEFSNIHQELFEASHNIRKIKLFPIENSWPKDFEGNYLSVFQLESDYGSLREMEGSYGVFLKHTLSTTISYPNNEYGVPDEYGDGWGSPLGDRAECFGFGRKRYGLGYDNGAGFGQKIGNTWHLEEHKGGNANYIIESEFGFIGMSEAKVGGL